MDMYDDMPPLLVDSRGYGSPPQLAQASVHPSAGATPWQHPAPSIAPSSTPVIPGGFGAGVPQPHLHPYPYEGGQVLRRTHSTPARAHIVFPRSPSMGGGRYNHDQGYDQNVINPLFAPPQGRSPPPPSLGGGGSGGGSGSGGVDPFSMPAAAFDAGAGAGQGFHHHQQAWNMGMGMGSPAALPRAMPSPWHTSTPHTHQQDPLDGEDAYEPPGLAGWGAEGWNAFRVHSPGGSSGGTGPSPSASVINGFATGPRSAYKRPEDWREGFSMSRPGPLTKVFSLGRGSRIGGFFGRPSLHRVLDAKQALCSWDIRRPPGAFITLPDQQPLDYLQLQEGAMTPEPVRMKIVHPMLPWTIHIDAGGPGHIITVGHLLASLYAGLMLPVYHRDFWNESVTEGDRKKIYDAWLCRCRGSAEVAKLGLKRVDFLLDRWVFEGLRRVDDCWEMKLKSGRKMM